MEPVHGESFTLLQHSGEFGLSGKGGVFESEIRGATGGRGRETRSAIATDGEIAETETNL